MYLFIFLLLLQFTSAADTNVTDNDIIFRQPEDAGFRLLSDLKIAPTSNVTWDPPIHFVPDDPSDSSATHGLSITPLTILISALLSGHP